MHDKCVFCTRFHEGERHLSDDLNSLFTYPQSYFSNFEDDFFLKKVSLFVHYHGIICSSRDKNFFNNYGNFGVLDHEQVDGPFLLYKFYLEIFGRVTFNNAIKKILKIFLPEIDMKTGSDCRKMSYCDNEHVLMGKDVFRKKKKNKETYELIKMTSTFAFMCVDQIHNFVDIKSNKNIFDTYRKKY